MLLHDLDIPHTLALPILTTPVNQQEDALSSGQHRTCHFWNKAAGLSRSEMPSAFWPVPRAVPKHIANDSCKRAPKGIRFFCFSWETGSSKAIYFQGPWSTKRSKVDYFIQAVRSLAQHCKHHQNSNCQGLFSTDRRSAHCPQVAETEEGSGYPQLSEASLIYFYKTLPPSVVFFWGEIFLSLLPIF